MDKKDREIMAQHLADMAINNCDNAFWDKLEKHAEANWSASPDTIIRTAIFQIFNLEY